MRKKLNRKRKRASAVDGPASQNEQSNVGTSRTEAAAVGKGQPPKATRWRKGQSGNPKGKASRPPDEAEFIDRLFRRPVEVIEAGETVRRTGFSIIFTQLLNKESAGDRRAGRVRDRYEAFARAEGGKDQVLLRYVEDAQASIDADPCVSADEAESLLENSCSPDSDGVRGPDDLEVDVFGGPQVGEP